MDGKQLLRQLYDILQESSVSGWPDAFTSYWYLWQGATEFVTRTQCLKATATLTTVANQNSYVLPADFTKLFAKTWDNRLFITLYDGTSYYQLFKKSYDSILYETPQAAVQYPYSFTIINNPSVALPITGTASATGALSSGQSVLTCYGGNFAAVSPGDSIHDTSDSSQGLVLNVTSPTQLVTALFAGSNNFWTAGDGFTIIPQVGSVLLIDPPPSIAGYTLSVPYMQRPAPVFSDFGQYPFQAEYCLAICFYGTWLYKYRDSKPDQSDKFYQNFDIQVKRYIHSLGDRLNDNSRMRVNMKPGRR